MISNKVTLLALTALVIYGLTNVIFEKKLSNYNIYAVQAYSYAVMLVLTSIGWIFAKRLGQDLPSPSGSIILLSIGLGILFFLADTFYLGAYNKNYGGGNVFAVTTIVVMFPVLAGIIKNIWDGGRPNKWQVVSYIFAAVATLAAAKGNK
ncbi:MAG TPA: EamA family transporter [Candidatus Paceibacterota bacterium]